MKAMTQPFEVETIVFISNDSEVLVKGTYFQEHMSYETEVIVTQTQLNQILNQLGRNNSSFAWSDWFQRETVEEGALLYYADFACLSDPTIDLSVVSDASSIRQIRA